MNRSSLAASAFVLLAALAIAPPAVAEDGGDLESGRIDVSTVAVKGSDVPMVVVRAIVRSPPANVWKVVSDCAHYKDRLPHTAASKQLSKSGNKVTCEVTIAVPFPMSNLTAVTEAVHDESPERMTRTWKLVRGDYEFNDGSWEVRPHDGGKASLVTYKVHAKPNAAVPGFLKNMAQKKALPELIERLRVEAAKIK
jgi:ribosome-associated toxin RatA of RatAB toxin-antitoxin module